MSVRSRASAKNVRRPPARRPASPRAATNGGKGAAHTQALSRGLALLETLAATQGGATLTVLAEALALPAPTAHRLLATLEQAGFVEAGVNGAWRIGVRAFRAGSAFLSHRNLVAQALPRLEWLMGEAGETANLAVIEDGEAVFVAQAQCRELMRMSVKLGARGPMHASGVGKAMLAAMTEPDAAKVMARGLKRLTPQTLVTREALAADLAATRARGYAIDDQEHAPGLRCVAAPIYDENGRPWAALSLAGPTSRLTPERVAHLGRLVREAALDTTLALGGQLPGSPKKDGALR